MLRPAAEWADSPDGAFGGDEHAGLRTPLGMLIRTTELTSRAAPERPV